MSTHTCRYLPVYILTARLAGSKSKPLLFKRADEVQNHKNKTAPRAYGELSEPKLIHVTTKIYLYHMKRLWLL